MSVGTTCMGWVSPEWYVPPVSIRVQDEHHHHDDHGMDDDEPAECNELRAIQLTRDQLEIMVDKPFFDGEFFGPWHRAEPCVFTPSILFMYRYPVSACHALLVWKMDFLCRARLELLYWYLAIPLMC